ncbi:MAG: hypothetical protein ABJD07_12790 [Gemmatimonadaceae bacterium]
MSDADSIELPLWAEVGERRRAHIARVTRLLDEWARAMRVSDDERASWHDAGVWHDALRDASEPRLRALSGDVARPVDMLHGPAAATLLGSAGEPRADLLDAIRWHTTGCDGWSRVGRALYMADYLEPGRKFSRADRTWLAAQVPTDFDGVFRQVVRSRLEWALREGNTLFAETVAMWNRIR